MSLKKFQEFINESEEEKSYSFNELSPEAQREALDNYRDINVDYLDWHDYVIDEFKEEMKEKFGFEVDDVRYSGFYSQGDGASFTGEAIDKALFLKNALGVTSSSDVFDNGEDSEEDELRSLMGDLRNIGFDNRERFKADDLYFNVRRRQHGSMYVHENTIDGDVDADWLDLDDDDERDFDGFVQDLERKTTGWAREQSRDLYRRLQDEYDAQTSDEAVKDTLIDNDYTFDEEGRIR
jgi:hypothetical protein